MHGIFVFQDALRRIGCGADEIVEEELAILRPPVPDLEATGDHCLLQRLVLRFQPDAEGVVGMMVFTDADRLRFITGKGDDEVVSAVWQTKMKIAGIFRYRTYGGVLRKNRSVVERRAGGGVEDLPVYRKCFFLGKAGAGEKERGDEKQDESLHWISF